MSTSTPEALPPSISPLLFRQALERAESAMAALKDDELIEVNLDLISALMTILGFADSEAFKELRQRAAVELPKFDLAHFDSLVTYALAAAQAHMDMVSTSKAVGLQELGGSLEKSRSLLKSEIELLHGRGVIDGSRLSELRGAVGYKNLVFDALLCVTILRSQWNKIGERAMTTLAELDQVEQLAGQLMVAVGTRDVGPSTPTQESDRRTRAATLMVNSHGQVLRAGTYLRWDQGDIDRIIPSIYPNRGSSRSKPKPAEGGVAPTPQSATQPTNGGSNGAVAPAAPAAKPAPPPPANGMPDEDPFAKG
ncbi:MAG: hypothetical protein U0271_47620 [Polyangiaceae bacterium]